MLFKRTCSLKENRKSVMLLLLLVVVVNVNALLYLCSELRNEVSCKVSYDCLPLSEFCH